jgi:hypothetical protein
MFPSPVTKKPGGVREPTPGEQLYWDTMEVDLEDDDTLPTCDLTEDEEDDDSINDEFLHSDIGNDHAYNASQEDYDDEPTSKCKKINKSKYESANIDQVVCACTHLNMVQQNDLQAVLEKYPVLFNNELGVYPDELIHLDLLEDAVSHATRAYTVPHNHQAVFKAELDRLVRIGVQEEGSCLEWIAGTFIMPKKLLPGEETPRVRWISDFCGLNKALKRKSYPIPRIGDILAQRTGYQFLFRIR